MTNDEPRTAIELRAELDRLRATRTFRWTQPMRTLYARLRSSDQGAARSSTTGSPYRQPHHVGSAEECRFYHTMDVPGHGMFEGEWDLRPRVDEYLGNLALSGKRVLEIGPASGFLTFHMERAGAEIVSVEVPRADLYDDMPAWYRTNDVSPLERERGHEKFVNGYWFAHEAFGSRARVHEATAYDVPDSLGTFDVAVLAAVLLHLRDPARALEACARLTTESIVVTDLWYPDASPGPVLKLMPTSENRISNTWWKITPEFVTGLLDVFGFRSATVTYHEQHYVTNDEMWPFFTVVASR